MRLATIQAASGNGLAVAAQDGPIRFARAEAGSAANLLGSTP